MTESHLPASAEIQLKSVTVEGFKSIADSTAVEIRPLTVLAGANSSGKSSLVQPLLLLKQTLEAPFDPGPLLLDGPNVRFTGASQMLSQTSRRPATKFGVKIEATDGRWISLSYRRSEGKGFVIDDMSSQGGGLDMHLHEGMSSQEIEAALDKGLLDQLQQVIGKHVGSPLRVKRERCYLTIVVEGHDPGRESSTLWALSPWVLFGQHVSGLIHLPALRGNPRRLYPATTAEGNYPVTFENYAAAVLHKWHCESDSARVAALNEYLQTLKLTRGAYTRSVDDTSIELTVARFLDEQPVDDRVNVSDVGFGVSQTFPVLVALIAAYPGQVVYIEQPEIHLHPRAQHAMGFILANAAARGVRVLAETHSTMLLLGIQTAVATGSLEADKVKLHWFTRSPDGTTRVDSRDMDACGRYGDWPVDFADVGMDARNKYLSAGVSRSHGTGA